MSTAEQVQATHKRSGFSGLSITSFILSLLGILFALTAIPGLVLGVLDLVRSRSRTERRGLSIAAVIISGIWILLFGLIILVGSASNGDSDEYGSSVEDQMAEIRSLDDTQSAPNDAVAQSEPPAEDSFLAKMARSLFDDLDAQEQLSACTTYRNEGRLFASWELVTFLTLPSRMSTQLSEADKETLIDEMGSVLAESCR